MESLGIDFSASGSVMNKSQLEEKRRKCGECLTCGQKCFQKKFFQMIPIDDHGKVLNGRCLRCKPLNVNNGEAIPAVSRPATQQDLERFTRSHSHVVLGEPGVKPMTRRVQSANPTMSLSSAVSADSTGARSMPAASRQLTGSGNSNVSNDDMDGDYDNSSLRSRESLLGHTDRSQRLSPRQLSSSGVSPSSGLRRQGDLGQSTGRMDSTRGQASSPRAIHTIQPPPYLAVSPITEGIVKVPKNVDEDSGRFRQATVGSMAAHQLANKFRSNRKHAPPKSARAVASMSTGNYDDDADQEGSFGSLPSQGRSSLNSTGNSYKTDDDGIDFEPAHGILNRGGTMRFDRPRMPENFGVDAGIDQPFVPFSAMKSESSRTMSSISSLEDDNALNGRQRSWKHSTQFANSRSKSAVLVEDDSDGQLSSLYSKNSFNASSRQEQEHVSLESLMCEDDYLVIVDVMQANKHSSQVQNEALKNLSNLHLTNDQFDDIYSIGGLETTVIAMRTHPHNLELQVNGCLAIWNLSATQRNQIKLVSCGALDAILTAMNNFPDEAELQEKALAALSNLGAAERNQDQIIERDVVGKIVETMSRHSENCNIQAKACVAITNLASYESPIKQKIMESGGSGAIVISMAMHQEDVDLQEKALRALRNICANSDENKVEVANVGGIDTVISAMQVHRDEPGVQEAGAWTLSNLAVNPDNKAVIGDSGGVDVVIRAMWVHSDHVGVQEWCCRALWTLSVNAQNREIMIEVGGISAIINCMQAHTDAATVQEKGCGVLNNLAATDDACKIRIVEEEALDAIVMAMVLHSDNCGVQDRACSVLKRLAIAPNLNPMQAANVAELVRQAGHQFPERCGDKAKQILKLL